MKRHALTLLLLAALAGWIPAAAQEKETSKQAVEKRLRDVQKEKSSLSVEKAIDALSAVLECRLFHRPGGGEPCHPAA